MADILLMLALLMAMTALGAWVGLLIAQEARDIARSTRSPHDPDKETPPPGWECPTEADLLDHAWGIMANVGNGDWSAQLPEWREAVRKWEADWMAVRRSRP